MKKFFQKLWWEEYIEISNLKQVLDWSYIDILNKNRLRDLYILWWKKKWVNKRAWDNDIEFKSYFLIDIDIRENYKKLYWKILSEVELNWKIKILILLLNMDKFLKKWSYIVNSWNWVHVYYCGNPLFVWIDINPEEYSIWVKNIYDSFVKYLDSFQKDYKYFYPDYSCSNIARPSRLPFSYNRKRKYGLWFLPVKIFDTQDVKSELIEMIPLLWKDIKKYVPIVKGRKNKSGWWYINININDYKIENVVKKYTWKDPSKWNISCVFWTHEDKHPSFSIDVKKNICKCFSCNKGGNPAQFIKILKNVSYKEALEILKKEF